MSTAGSNRFIRPKESKHGYRRGENAKSDAYKDCTWIRIWKFGCSLTKPNRVMCDNWMSATMIGTKKTATAGIRNSDLCRDGARKIDEVALLTKCSLCCNKHRASPQKGS